MQEHNQVCVNLVEACGKCEVNYLPNSSTKHDCIQCMISINTEMEDEYSQLKIDLGINYDQVNVLCKNGQPMKVQRGIIY